CEPCRSRHPAFARLTRIALRPSRPCHAALTRLARIALRPGRPSGSLWPGLPFFGLRPDRALCARDAAPSPRPARAGRPCRSALALRAGGSLGSRGPGRPGGALRPLWTFAPCKHQRRRDSTHRKHGPHDVLLPAAERRACVLRRGGVKRRRDTPSDACGHDVTGTADARVDVLIGGGGFAGLSLPIALRQALGSDFSVTLADPALAAPGRDARASAIAAAARRLFETVGAWQEVQAAAQPILDMVITDSRLGDAMRPVFLTFDGELQP